MNDRILQNAINIIRNLQEDGAMGGAPTNSAGTGGFSGSSDPKGPVAGYDPVMKFDGRSKIARRLPRPYKSDLIKKKKKKEK
jgi:hypothetical protein